MQVAKNRIVTIEYTLTDDEGLVLDTSRGGEPFSYIQGSGSIPAGLESALEGRSPGDEFRVDIPPEQAYGERDESLVEVVPIERFEGAENLEIGQRFQTLDESGPRVVTVIGIEGGNVTVDGNHPLAGETLHFDIKILDVRESAGDELD
jgi:FKBP-type peptidyl-prolyl cis-trans isomerase SlyD